MNQKSNWKSFWILLQREYKARVLTKQFLLLTILGPLILTGLMVVPIWLASDVSHLKVVSVVDHNPGSPFTDYFPESKDLNFIHHGKADTSFVLQVARNVQHDAVLYLPKVEQLPKEKVVLWTYSPLPESLKQMLFLRIQKKYKDLQVDASSMDLQTKEILQTEIEIKDISLHAQSKQTENTTRSISALVLAVCIYFFVFIYGAQVMRGVLEEKMSRLYEIMLVSVSALDLLRSKIAAIALLGFTQILIWVSTSSVLSFWFYHRFQLHLFQNPSIHQTIQKVSDPAQALEMNQILNGIQSVPFTELIGMFLVFFLLGYVLYSAFFACIAAVSEAESDTQSYVFPLTFPLILSVMLSQYMVEVPHGKWSIFLSMFPLTSPVAMLVRLPFGVSVVELCSSVGILAVSTWLSLYFAARVYAKGIRTYGRKVPFSEWISWASKKISTE